MADVFDVADSTDWIGTPLAFLSPIEAGLRCQVCKDLFNTPMITSCCHTFCSICIRRCLSNDGKCPTCRTPDQELKLRKNAQVEELVAAFVIARPAALDYARNPPTFSRAASPKRKYGETNLAAADDGQPPKKTRSSSRIATKITSGSDTIVIDAAVDDDDYQPDYYDGLVSCPICSKRVKEATINSHLDRCSGEHEQLYQRPSASSAPRLNPVKTDISISQRPALKPDRLPALSYNLYKEAMLRKKLGELGISATGSRQLLERRHTEWMTIWNANCDSSRPRRKAELLRDLDIWERTQGGRAAFTNALNVGNQITSKDFDGAAYSAKHDASFQDLVAQARRNAKDNKQNEKGDPKLDIKLSGNGKDQEVQDEDPQSFERQINVQHEQEGGARTADESGEVARDPFALPKSSQFPQSPRQRMFEDGGGVVPLSTWN